MPSLVLLYVSSSSFRRMPAFLSISNPPSHFRSYKLPIFEWVGLPQFMPEGIERERSMPDLHPQAGYAFYGPMACRGVLITA